MIERVLNPADKTSFRRAIDEADGTVMPQQEGGRDIANCRTAPIVRAAHGEQELMVGRSDPDAFSLLLAPMEEAS